MAADCGRARTSARVLSFNSCCQRTRTVHRDWAPRSLRGHQLARRECRLRVRKRTSGANNNRQLYPHQQTPLLTTGHCVRCWQDRRAQCYRPLPAGGSACELAEIIGLQESLRAGYPPAPPLERWCGTPSLPPTASLNARPAAPTACRAAAAEPFECRARLQKVTPEP
jgi:hypothetical protein